MKCDNCLREVTFKEVEEQAREGSWLCLKCGMGEIRTDTFTTDRGRAWFICSGRGISIIHENPKKGVEFRIHGENFWPQNSPIKPVTTPHFESSGMPTPARNVDYVDFDIDVIKDVKQLNKFLKAVDQVRELHTIYWGKDVI